MKIYLKNETEPPRLELVPLIDVLFCVLVFFLLATFQLSRYQAISVSQEKIPESRTGVSQITRKLVVSLDESRQVFIDGKFVALLPELISSTKSQAALVQNLRTYLSQNPNGQAVLYAPKTASYNDVLQTLDLLRLVMGDRVALGTLPSQ